MKKITFVCFNADHPRTGYAVRVMENIKELVLRGYDVSVLRLIPVFHSAESWQEALAKIGVINLHERPALPISRYSIARWLSPYIAFLWLILSKIKFKPDILIAEGHEASGVCLLLKSGPVIVDMHGAVVEEIIFSRKASGREYKKIVSWFNKIEKKIVEKSDLIVVVSENMVNYMTSKWQGLDKSKITILPVVFSGIRNLSNTRNKTSKSYKFIYSGGAQTYQCIDETIELFNKIKNEIECAQLRILSPDVQIIHSKIESIYGNVPNYIEIKSVTQSDVINYLVDSDFGIVLRGDDVLNKVSCPTKINEYLAAGLIIICTPFSGHGPSAIEETGAGVVIDLNFQSIQMRKFIDNLDLMRSNYSTVKVNLYLDRYGPQYAFSAFHKMIQGLIK